MSKTTKVIYHSADYDGIFSREACRVHFGQDAEYIGWNWGDRVPPVRKNDNLIMVDLAIDELMDHLNLIWIDHHASAIEKYDKSIPGLRIDGVAACRLAWQWYHGDSDASKQDYLDRSVSEPTALTLVGEYDIWDHSDPDTLHMQFGLDALNFREAGNSEFDDLLLEEDEGMINKLLEAGEYAKAWSASYYKQVMEEISYDLEWEDLRFLVCNLSQGNSLSFDSVFDKERHDAVLSWKFDGTTTKISLYGIEGATTVDLSKIASKHGGGGHKMACGFRVDGFPNWLVGKKDLRERLKVINKA